MAALSKQTAQQEKRCHRRIEMRLPLEYWKAKCEGGQRSPTRTTCRNISPGGVYFEALAKDDIVAGTMLNLKLTIPPGEGHFPYQGRVSTVCEVVRATAIDVDGQTDANGGGGHSIAGYRRMGIAAQFRDILKLSF